MPQARLTDVCCHYEIQGCGEPVLLVPGLGSTSRTWDSLVPDLSESHCVITFDHRGTGLSKALRPATTLHHYAADVIELLDHLQLQNVHVIGMSFGGMITQWLAIDHPSRVGRLILMSTAHQMTPYLGELAHLLGHAVYLLPRQMFERLLALLTTSPLALDRGTSSISRGLNDEVPASEIVRQLRCITRSVPTNDDYRIQSQTLVLAGEFDALIPSCFGRTMASMIPNGRFRLISGAGHNVLGDAPRETVSVIRTFLKSGVTFQPGEMDQAEAMLMSA